MKWWIPLVLLAFLMSDCNRPQESASQETARVTYYTIRGTMTSGRYTYEGALACSWNIPLGSVVVFSLDGRVGVCEDRGDLGYANWIDIFVSSADDGRYLASLYGDYADVEILTPSVLDFLHPVS